MKFTHKEDKTKIFETENKNLFSMLKREGYEPKGGWKSLEEVSEEKEEKTEE
jgi:hypothetical protein